MCIGLNFVLFIDISKNQKVKLNLNMKFGKLWINIEPMAAPRSLIDMSQIQYVCVLRVVDFRHVCVLRVVDFRYVCVLRVIDQNR